MKYSLQALQCHVHVHVKGVLNVELLSYNEKYNFISMLNVHVTNGAMSNNRTRSPSCRIHLPTLGSPTAVKETPPPAAAAAVAAANCHTIQRMGGPRVINVSSALKLVSLGKMLCLMFWGPRSKIQPDNCELNPGFWCKCGRLLILDATWLVSVTSALEKFRILLMNYSWTFVTVEFAKQAQRFGSLVGSFVCSSFAWSRISRKSAGCDRAVLAEPAERRVLSLLEWLRRALHL